MTYKLPEGWEKSKLGEIFEYRSGLSKGKKYFGTGHPYLSFKEVFNNYFVPEELIELVESTETERKNMSIKKGDVFLTRTSETFDELGMSAVALKDYEDSTFNGFTKRLRPKDIDKLYPKFSAYYFRSNIFRNQVDSISTMTTRASLNNSMLDILDIIIPPINEQKVIGETLSSLDDKIELNTKINENLEQQAQAIFKHWFVDFEFPDENGSPYKSSGGEMVESELGMIPKGWEVGTINDLGDVVGGSTPSRKNSEYFTTKGIPWITPKDLSNNKNIFINKGEEDITEEGFNSTSVKILPRGTVLFSSRAPIGYIGIAKNDVTTNQGFKSIVLNKEKGISTGYIFNWLKYHDEEIENRASGSTFKEISGGELKKITAIIPGLKILDNFEKLQNSYFNILESNEDEINILTQLRDTLLPKLMSGELRIPLNR